MSHKFERRLAAVEDLVPNGRCPQCGYGGGPGLGGSIGPPTAELFRLATEEELLAMERIWKTLYERHGTPWPFRYANGEPA
jgi:hypothetical protein